MSIETHRVIALIAKIHNEANRLIAKGLKDNGFSQLVPSHGGILATLYQNEMGVTMNEITKKIDKDKSTVTTLINKLERLELVEKVKNEKDSRSTIVRLTKKGLEVKPIVFEEISKRLIKTAYKNFSEEEKELVCSLLKKMEKNFLQE